MMGLFRPESMTSAVLRESKRGGEWAGHQSAAPNITIGHFYCPHAKNGKRSSRKNANSLGRLDHYLFYQNFSVKSVIYTLSPADIAIANNQGKYDFRFAQPYEFHVRCGRDIGRMEEGEDGPVGWLSAGQGRIHTRLELKRKGNNNLALRRVELESDGDWDPMKCPCCSGFFHI
ncbi:hypothetical protein [Actinoplanes palleronii]|nr:hypothetical protein [Actinoplanes palleronii]